MLEPVKFIWSNARLLDYGSSRIPRGRLTRNDDSTQRLTTPRSSSWSDSYRTWFRIWVSAN